MSCKRFVRLIAYPGFYVLLAFVITTFFCFCCSPFWNVLELDQSMFSIIGGGWSQGRLPYVDLWDSKGPIIFFVNMLGHSIAPGENGVYILQTLNLAGVLLLSHFFMRRYCMRLDEIACQLIFLLFYVLVCKGGNQVGDATLFFSTLSVFLAYEWTQKANAGDLRHSWKSAFVYGVFAASCLLSRLTNCSVVVTFAMLVAVLLVYKRLWHNLLVNLMAFVVGFSLAFIPFAIYFGCYGAFQEMWYAMFSYNLEYAELSHYISGTTHVYRAVLDFIFYFFCLSFPLLVCALSLIMRKRRFVNIFLALSVVPTYVWIFNSYAFEHYAISYLPLIMISLVEIRKLIDFRGLYIAIPVVVIMLVVLHIRLWHYYKPNAEPIGLTQKSIEMTDNVPKCDTFVAYNISPTFYIYADREPDYRFFTMQDWAIENGPSLRQKVVDCYRSGRAEWILVYQYGQSNIRGVLDENYELYRYDEKYDLSLFKRQ